MNLNNKQIPFIKDIDLTNKTCVVRLDLNVPIKNGEITDSSRIIAAKKTIDYLLNNNCKLVILSHLSRIKTADDITSGKKSLALIAKKLKEIFPKNKISFVANNIDKTLPKKIKSMHFKEILLLENTRYQDFDIKTQKLVKLESKNDSKLAKFWASLGDVFVNDAFATIHRNHASNAGIASFSKVKCIGFLIKQELENILKFNSLSPKPIISIVGGAKIADKIILLEKLFNISDLVLIGGGMAFTFLKSLGVNIGKSLVEEEMLPVAKKLYSKYKKKMLLPLDIACCQTFTNGTRQEFSIKKIPNNLMGLDIGKKTIKQYTKIINKANTIFWNGPTGVFEFDNFANSTKAIVDAIVNVTSKNDATSIIGGGDTAAAALKFAKKTDFTWVSTGGGATLAVIQDDPLPGIFYK